MVLGNITYPNLRKWWITGNLEKFVDIIIQTSSSIDLFASLALLNYNNAADTNDADYESAINTVTSQNVTYNSNLQNLRSGSANTKLYAEVESALDSWKTVLSGANIQYNILANIIAYHVTTLTNHKSDYYSYSKDDWALWENNNSILYSFFTKEFEVLNTFLTYLLTVTTTSNYAYISILSVKSNIQDLLSSIKSITTTINAIQQNLSNGIETTSAQLDTLTSNYSTVKTKIKALTVKFSEIFTGTDNSLDHV